MYGIRGAAQLFDATDAPAFDNACRIGRVEDCKLRKTLVVGIRAVKEDSVERSVLRGCLYVTTTANETHLLLANDATEVVGGSADDVNSVRSEEEDVEEAVRRVLCSDENIAGLTATVASNVILQTYDGRHVSTTAPQFGPAALDFAIEERLSQTDRVRRYLQRTFLIARNDWHYMLSAGHITTVSKGLFRTDEIVIRDALKSIFRPDHVKLLSWRTREVRQREGSISFPAVMRNTSQ